jgi:hypothetical protein
VAALLAAPAAVLALTGCDPAGPSVDEPAHGRGKPVLIVEFKGRIPDGTQCVEARDRADTRFLRDCIDSRSLPEDVAWYGRQKVGAPLEKSDWGDLLDAATGEEE